MLSARSGAPPFVKHSYAGLHSTSGVSGVRLRFAPADARHALSSATTMLRYASLSMRTLGRSEKRCLGTATQSLGVFVRCRLTPSALVPASPMVTQAPATAFACSQLATLARNTQAPATAFACFQLATLAQKKRCLGTASQSLGVFVRCRLTPSALVPAP